MLNINIILFSRTITNDYRWIYWAESVKAEEANIILNDYKEFEKNRDFFTINPHLIVRQLCEKVAIYYFSETKRIDQNSRKIYALQGCVLSDADFELAKVFLPYICGYLFFNRLDILYTYDITDNTLNAVKPETISLDLVVSEYKNNNRCFTLIQRIATFTHQYPNDSFIITDDYIGLVKETICSSNVSFSKTTSPLIKNSSEITPAVGFTKITINTDKCQTEIAGPETVDSSDHVNAPHKQQYTQSINDILNETNKDRVQPDTKRVEKSIGSCLDTICSLIKKKIVK